MGSQGGSIKCGTQAMRYMKTSRHDDRTHSRTGFTLIELMVVVAILMTMAMFTMKIHIMFRGC